MGSFRDWPVKWKIIFITLTVTTLSLMLCVGILLFKDLYTFKENWMSNLRVLSQTVGLPERAGETIDNPALGKKLLASLGKVEDVVAAALYDEKDRLVALYRRNENIPFPEPTTLRAGEYLSPDRLEIIHPVYFGTRSVGKLYLSATHQRLKSHMQDLYWVVALLLLVILPAAAVLALLMQRMVSNPLLALADTTRWLSENPDYSIRVAYNHKDEIGALFKGFNTMLSAIEERDYKLDKSHKDLLSLLGKCRLSEEEAKKNLILYQNIINNAFDGIVTMNAEGRITGWNRRAEAIFGWRADEIIGSKLSDTLIPPRYREQHTEGLNRFLKTGKGTLLNQQIELEVLHKEGREVPIEISISASPSQGSYVFTGILRDIGERKKIEQSAQRRQKELERYRSDLEKLVVQQTADLQAALTRLKESNELKNKFLGIASHDLRNPVYLIHSYSEILKDESLGQVNAKQKSMLEKIFHSSWYMTKLLDNLLDISKIESGKIYIDRKKQDLNTLAQSQVELIQLLANKKDIRLEARLEETPPVYFDTSAMTQVMGNFIGNAIKFSPPGTRIVVATQKAGAAVRFSVTDEGPGLSEEDKKLTFGEFQTLSAKPTGDEKSTGLGLAIVKKIIHLHGGEVGVESEPGKGATFYCTLPVDGNRAGNEPEEEA
jgi:PAS domain S-box-containing protein